MGIMGIRIRRREEHTFIIINKSTVGCRFARRAGIMWRLQNVSMIVNVDCVAVVVAVVVVGGRCVAVGVVVVVVGGRWWQFWNKPRKGIAHASTTSWTTQRKRHRAEPRREFILDDHINQSGWGRQQW